MKPVGGILLALGMCVLAIFIAIFFFGGFRDRAAAVVQGHAEGMELKEQAAAAEAGEAGRIRKV